MPPWACTNYALSGSGSIRESPPASSTPSSLPRSLKSSSPNTTPLPTSANAPSPTPSIFFNDEFFLLQLWRSGRHPLPLPQYEAGGRERWPPGDPLRQERTAGTRSLHRKDPADRKLALGTGLRRGGPPFRGAGDQSRRLPLPGQRAPLRSHLGQLASSMAGIDPGLLHPLAGSHPRPVGGNRCQSHRPLPEPLLSVGCA